jgi:hypothetical protein
MKFIIAFALLTSFTQARACIVFDHNDFFVKMSSAEAKIASDHNLQFQSAREGSEYTLKIGGHNNNAHAHFYKNDFTVASDIVVMSNNWSKMRKNVLKKLPVCPSSLPSTP